MHTSNHTPEQALQLLQEGNQRYINSCCEHPHQSSQRRTEVSAGQHPFAAVLSCADSRVPVELIFDQGIGDLFVLRNAGNVVDDVILGSIEYGVEHLGINLVLVLGHTRCGAVTAAVQGGKAEGHLGSILDQIAPSVSAAAQESGDPVLNATRANVSRMVEQVRTSQPVLAALVQAGKIQVIGGIYDLQDGRVEFTR